MPHRGSGPQVTDVVVPSSAVASVEPSAAVVQVRVAPEAFTTVRRTLALGSLTTEY
jgi:hypothetical protein